ncbi:MAG: MBL fold metallo-hydrolase [Ruminococcus sp.]|jgi:Cft2 family RNA processing exonuclease|nr:MBL fold metallo-hydrolase [Ruminococcus sp.]
MNLHFLGGAMEIGGSCIYIRIAGKGILMDSGIRQSNSKDPLPDFRTIQEEGGLDAIIVSHAHMDHIGTLPMISKAFPSAPVYMTAMTTDLTRVLLYDSLKIMKYREDEIPHYSEQDVLAMLGRIHPLGYQTPFPIFDKFTLTFYPAGHIAGAACIYLTTEEGSLFYSGDFSNFSQRTIEGARIPKLRPDAAIVETTYGNRLHANRQIEEKRLVELVGECIRQEKKILIPAFALGRSQEVLLILRAAIQNQEIPPVPVYVDGMVRDINIMYTRNPTYLKNALGKRVLKGNEPFYTKEIQPVQATQKREELLKTKGPAIFLSSSGMLTGGPSAQYAKELASLENACIIITGYQDEESPGRQLLNLLENPEERTLSINGSTVPVRCRIEQVGLSAHGDKSEIMALLERLSARRIFLVHGNREVIDELGSELAAEDYRRQIYLPECGQAYEITLHNKRKQLSFCPPHTLQMKKEFTENDEKRLWEYWQEHYFGKAFSVSQIAHIWYGKSITDDALLQKMQEPFLHSPYFSPNTRRLFLFEATSPEDVKEALAPKELTQQEVSAQIEAAFHGFSYRKLSYHGGQRKVLLQFDYPDAQDMEDFQKKAQVFADATGWTAQISPSMNHNAALLLLTMLFGERLTKTSYYADKKCYTVALSGDESQQGSDKKASERFCSTTGWALSINGQPMENSTYAVPLNRTEQKDFFFPANPSVEKTEQNTAFFCIDQTFEELPHKPDKKSLKQDSKGSYLELSFISPMVGRMYGETLQMAADQIGWRIHIADKVNQNALFKTAQLLCMKAEIPLAKNPSYLPEKRMVQLKIQKQENDQALQDIAAEFLKQTGCSCTFSIQPAI